MVKQTIKVLVGCSITWVFMLSNGHASIMQNCELNGRNLTNHSHSSPSQCRTLCENHNGCVGMVLISGWNKCFLKSKVKNKIRLTMYSGEKHQAPLKNRDYTGKDDRQVIAESPDSCAQKCNKDTRCKGYTYIDGYRTCWLKKSQGQLKKKIFYCWIK